MSTSNSNVPLGECVVCGQETATRCSKCAQGGVKWMFFCSKEHQRAIWNVHKRVCGSPFHWPVLNLKEKDEILELSPKPFRDRQGRTNTWLNQSHETMEGQKDFVEKLMVLHDDPHPSAYMLLCNYRYNAFRIKYALKDPAHRGLGFVAYHQLIASDPLGFLAYTHCLHCPKVEQNPEAEWYSDYQHRMLCLIGVFIFAFDQPPAEGKLDQSVVVMLNGYVDYAVKQVQNLARNVIQKSDPNMAKRIVAHLPAMLNQIGAST